MYNNHYNGTHRIECLKKTATFNLYSMSTILNEYDKLQEIEYILKRNNFRVK